MRFHDSKYPSWYVLPLGGALSGDLNEMLSDYNERYEKYKRLYPTRNFSAPCHRPYAVRVLYFPDVQRYIKRLNKLFHDKYKTSFRYFVCILISLIPEKVVLMLHVVSVYLAKMLVVLVLIFFSI